MNFNSFLWKEISHVSVEKNSKHVLWQTDFRGKPLKIVVQEGVTL